MLVITIIGRDCRSIRQNIDFQCVVVTDLKTIHRTSCLLRFLMSCILNDSVATVLALGVFGKFNLHNFTKWFEKLCDFGFRLLFQGSSQTANINPVVLFAFDRLCRLIGRKGVLHICAVILTAIPIRIIKCLLFVFADDGLSILFGLGCLNHDGLALELLT
jgi:MFS-type transporter involved in bile tolerance (Atg22 family)